MIVIPAIDLKNGQCVRLFHGEADKQTIYSDNPLDMAQRFQREGATRLHVIDLDGAFSGESKNLEWIARIKKETGLMVQVGGGLRSLEAVQRIFDLGVDRAIL